MKLTKKKRKEILPFLQKIVQAKIDQWETEREIEHIVEDELNHMNSACEYFAVGHDTGDTITLDDVDDYLSMCVRG